MHLEALQEIALRVSGERSVEGVLRQIVDGLAHQPGVALARVWVVSPGDLCDSGDVRSCDDQSACLHLAASAGASLAGESWSRTDGRFRRIPLGQLKVGSIAANRTGLLLSDPSSEQWARPEWVRHESIQSFAGQPLVFRDETLGVLAVFRRQSIDDQEFRWLRMFADQAASAIANARAFSELERLRQQLEFHNAYLKEEVETALAFGSIVGRSRAVHQVLEQVKDVARTDATVLILGESGTGKELLANEIHHRGLRAQRNFVRVNCSAIPREVFESEFFGHVRGAFTGALRDRPGRFQVADGGTIFLDEVGELPLDMQPKLLRVLQEGQYERVGEDVTRKVDVRVVAATNQDLQAETRARRFRQDLFYRLNVFPIELPPLRARKEDIPLLAAHFVAQASRRHGVPLLHLTKEDGERLQRYEWPGNIRELQNVIERAVILSKGERLRLDVALAGIPAAMASLPSSSLDTNDPILTEREWRDRERANLLNALRRSEGRIYGPGGAAELLGLKPTTLTSRLRALKIDIPSR
jgi:transcriptional regulator with GAF, ATPase, and Fis domain